MNAVNKLNSLHTKLSLQQISDNTWSKSGNNTHKRKLHVPYLVLSSGNIKVFICKLLSCFYIQLHQTILINNLHQNQLTYLILTYQPTDRPST